MTRHNHRLLFFLTALLFIFITALSTFAQVEADHARRSQQKIPWLGPHVFVPNNLIRDPFIAGYIRNSTGAGVSVKTRVPAIILSDSLIIGNLDASIAAVVVQFEYQHAVKDWLAVWGRLDIAGRLGTNEQSLISQGVNFISGFELGWMFRLVEAHRDALSLTVAMESNNGSFINLLEWVDRILVEGEIAPDNQLIRKKESLRGKVGLRYAHVFSPLFGLSANGELGYGEKLDQPGENKTTYLIGAGLSCNLHGKTKVPLGAYLGYSLNNLAEGGSELRDNVQSGVFRIAYTGHSDFLVSTDLGFTSTPVTRLDQTIKITTFKINLRYYF